MKTNQKTFDCVALQHEGGLRVQALIEGMSPEEFEAFWDQEWQDFQKQASHMPPRSGPSPVDELPPIPREEKSFDCTNMNHP